MSTVFDLLELEEDRRRELLALPEQQLEEVAAVCARYPDINLTHEFAGGGSSVDSVLAGESINLTVSLERELEAGVTEVAAVTAARFPGRRDEAWWLVVGDAQANTLLAIKRVVLNKAAKVKLEFSAPATAGLHTLKLFFMCDSYLGCDQEYELEVNVQEGGDRMEE